MPKLTPFGAWEKAWKQRRSVEANNFRVVSDKVDACGNIEADSFRAVSDDMEATPMRG